MTLRFIQPGIHGTVGLETRLRCDEFRRVPLHDLLHRGAARQVAPLGEDSAQQECRAGHRPRIPKHGQANSEFSGRVVLGLPRLEPRQNVIAREAEQSLLFAGCGHTKHTTASGDTI